MQRLRAPAASIALVTFALAASCSRDDAAPRVRAPAPPSAAAVAAGATDVELAADSHSHRRRERPLPAFSGVTLDDTMFSVSSLVGRRGLIVFFNPEVTKVAGPVIDALVRLSEQRSEHNFEIVGIAVGSDRETAQAFARSHRVEFPVVDDSAGRIGRRFGLRGPVTVVGIDAKGFLAFGIQSFPTQRADAPAVIEGELRSALRIPRDEPGEPTLGTRPLAPNFTAEVLDGDEPFELAAHRGRPVVVIFFLHTCPHCHTALKALKESLSRLTGPRTPVLVGVEVSGRTYAVRSTLAEEGLDFFPVVFDRDTKIRDAFGSLGSVPDILMIDDEGRIVARMRGWVDAEDAPVLRMRLAKMAGNPVPMLLRRVGYSGSEVCGICHEQELETWELTSHAGAFDTLVRHGAEKDGECVGCHVVGWEEKGGYASSPEHAYLEDVGCETCHGRGGPHLSPDYVADGNYAHTCEGCHDSKHSLGFEYSKFAPRVSHAANVHLLELPLEEKRKLMASRRGPREDLLPTTASFVGSDACRSCHAAEYATWAANAHAGAVETLKAAGKGGEKDCLRCHTTGFGKPGGFPSDRVPGAHADLERVGCESCHGPGGDHVAEGAARIGTIVSLGDKCDSCVILQICGSCHDDANDPGFEFEVQQKIDALRHGTIEAGTGRPLGESASLPRSPSPAERIAAGFALLDERG